MGRARCLATVPTGRFSAWIDPALTSWPLSRPALLATRCLAREERRTPESVRVLHVRDVEAGGRSALVGDIVAAGGVRNARVRREEVETRHFLNPSLVPSRSLVQPLSWSPAGAHVLSRSLRGCSPVGSFLSASDRGTTFLFSNVFLFYIVFSRFLFFICLKRTLNCNG